MRVNRPRVGRAAEVCHVTLRVLTASLTTTAAAPRLTPGRGHGARGAGKTRWRARTVKDEYATHG
ncbi:hypothetical protein GCM10010269_28230 [Streptomyces humidus]|uniref:Uncharacterized protein n=1 Tax=Streptomyces humidus TaxID=52259 RepID=A0A918FW98_9ACTN|nr:hypothetical protein GCM10010269_28230 [Streptomyces humidus]